MRAFDGSILPEVVGGGPAPSRHVYEKGHVFAFYIGEVPTQNGR